jgi:anti-sigma-K factor RskA
MIETEGHMPDREALAAEYVLGTLPLAERLTAEALIASDADFARMVEAWQARLAPLNADYAEVAAPRDMLGRIEARLFGVARRRRRDGWLWGLFGGAALALLGLVLVLPVLRPDRPDSTVTAILAGENQRLVIAARFDPAAGALTVTRSDGPAAGAGQDYELWIIPAGSAAVSLGLVRDDALSVPLDALPAGTTLAITLEPAGGAPGGVATGPILVSAVVGG